MEVWMRQSWWRWRNTNTSRMPFGGRSYGVHSEPVLSVKDIPHLVLGLLCIHSLGHSTNVSPACSHTFYPCVGKISWRRKWIFAWRIPWSEEPSGLQSTGSQRVRHNWSNQTGTTIWCPVTNWWTLTVWSCYEWNCPKRWRTSLCVNIIFMSLG